MKYFEPKNEFNEDVVDAFLDQGKHKDVAPEKPKEVGSSKSIAGVSCARARAIITL